MTFGGVADCAIVPGATTHVRAVCTVPAGAGTGVSVRIKVAGQTSNARTFAYSLPNITRVQGCPENSAFATSQCPIAGGTVITLTGTWSSFLLTSCFHA